MNGIHDMGGMDGFGAVVAPAHEPPFHDAWEGRVMAISRALAATGIWNIDQGRYGIERLPPEVYLTSSYHRKWHLRTEALLREAGLLSATELAGGHARGPAKPLPHPALRPDKVAATLVRGNYERPAQATARFETGEAVRTRNIHPLSHTRLPRYARGRTGVIDRIYGCHVFPDSFVLGKGDDPQWLYAVRFKARELWGADADPTVTVLIDAFEPYLARVPA